MSFLEARRRLSNPRMPEIEWPCEFISEARASRWHLSFTAVYKRTVYWRAVWCALPDGPPAATCRKQLTASNLPKRITIC